MGSVSGQSTAASSHCYLVPVEVWEQNALFVKALAKKNNEEL